MHERDSPLHLKKSMPKQKWTNRICRYYKLVTIWFPKKEI